MHRDGKKSVLIKGNERASLVFPNDQISVYASVCQSYAFSFCVIAFFLWIFFVPDWFALLDKFIAQTHLSRNSHESLIAFILF